jgi:membrane associated rhomboid family serine protease
MVSAPMPQAPNPQPGDGIYRSILWVMVLTVLFGAFLAILGETLFHDQGISRLGAIVALIGGAIYAFFRVLGTRENKRRAGGDGGVS